MSKYTRVRKIRITRITRKKSKVSKPTYNKIKNVVNKLINKKSETKMISRTSTALPFNSGIGSSAECYALIPNLGKGVESYQRVGDQITPSYLKISGVVRMNNPSSMPQPLYAYIYFIEDKWNKNGNVITADAYKFLNDNGNPVEFQGNFATACLPVDTKRFKLLRRLRIKLTQNYLNNVGVAPAADQITDPSGTIMRQFSFTIPLKGRKFSYETLSAGTTQPENCNFFWAAGYMNYNQTVDYALTGITVQINSVMWYKDS